MKPIKATLGLVFVLVYATSCFAAEQSFTRTEDVIYGRKFGTALTLDVFTPEKQNGAAVIFMVSGGWFSSHDAINLNFYKEFLNRGYTVFAVVHGSQPRYIATEVVQDIHRAIRFIRFNASKFGVDANKFGISGSSAGGHLSLTMATQGHPGKIDAKDPVDRASSEVQAAACFFPPTDFLNYGKEGEDAVGIGILKNFKVAFGPKSETAEGRQEVGKELSPIYFLSAATPPCLIIHGDADQLVPFQQAQRFVEKAKMLGVKAELTPRPGKAHGWAKMEEDVPLLADWFDTYLLKKPAKSATP